MPSLRIPWMSDRATRLWATSPTIATWSPSKCAFLSRIVRRSRSAWVGCSCAPSPAFTIEHARSEEHTSELQSRLHLVCRLLLEKKKYEQHAYILHCER